MSKYKQTIKLPSGDSADLLSEDGTATHWECKTNPAIERMLNLMLKDVYWQSWCRGVYVLAAEEIAKKLGAEVTHTELLPPEPDDGEPRVY